MTSKIVTRKNITAAPFAPLGHAIARRSQGISPKRCTSSGFVSRTEGISAPAPVWADWLWLKWLYAIRHNYRRMRERSRQRKALLDLDDRLLRDIGVTREEAGREGREWPWR